jgi:hypothetical protein
VYCGFALLIAFALITDDLMFVLIALLSLDNMPIRTWVRRVLYGAWWGALGIHLLVLFRGWVAYGLVVLPFIFAITCFYFAWVDRLEPLPPAPDDPQRVSFRIKMKWLTCYALLLTFIAGTMMWHTQHLPKEVRESTLMNFVREF